MNGTRLSAILGGDVIGYIEVEKFGAGERLPRHGGWADIGNLRVTEPYRRRGVASWLLGQAADWLRLADVDRLLDYAWLDGTDPGGLDYADYRAFLPAAGFRELTRTRRGWNRTPGNPGQLAWLFRQAREEAAMDLTVLAVPDCPNVTLLEQRLAQVIEGRRDVTVSRQVIADQDEAARRGMHGSPTILVDGIDPFAEPGEPASVSCRLYRDGDGQVDGAPSVSQLRQAIGEVPRGRRGQPKLAGCAGTRRPGTDCAYRGRPAGSSSGGAALLRGNRTRPGARLS